VVSALVVSEERPLQEPRYIESIRNTIGKPEVIFFFI
jgi:hypothetical protein